MPFDATPTLSLLHLAGAFPVLSETFVSNEIRALRALGHRVRPMALSAAPRPCQPEDEAFRAETLRLADLPCGGAMAAVAAQPAGLARALRFVAAQRGLPRRSLLLAGARVALAARREGATHIHAHFAHAPAATAIVAARLAGLTCSFTGHGFEVYGPATADLAAKLHAADLAVAVCEDMAATFRALVPAARVATLPCGVDAWRFAPSDAPANGRLLAIGRLAPQKGYEVLIEALALLPPDRRPVVEAVGGGGLGPALEARARALGVADRIRFLGPRPAGWIAAEGPRYQGFVAPYVATPDGDRDTGPVAAKEAMAMGLPVLASALMGLKQIVAPGTGRLVPPGDAAALAEGLAWLAALPADARRAMGAAGRRHVARAFSLEGQARGLAAAIAGIGR